ncbi:MAG: glycosyltransferase family 25 protein [Verrucomicrobiota bacterium]|nr:glycosyltransferase family 25 protein [Verrucomicrobiota bacterium]
MKNRDLLFFFLLPLFFLEASIERHFRSINNKFGLHSMPGIDFIYLINLDERPEKYQRTLNALQPYEITPYRFSAINGWKLSFDVIDELGIKYQRGKPPGPLCSVYRHQCDKEYASFEIMQEEGVSYYSHCMSRGAIGCILSHLSVLQDAYDSGYHTIWILEDDIRIASDPRELSTLIEQLDQLAPDWDVFFTDPEIRGADGDRVYCGGIRPRPNFQTHSLSYYYERQSIHPDLFKLGLRFGSHSMIIRRSGMKKLLDFFKTYKMRQLQNPSFVGALKSRKTPRVSFSNRAA